MKNRGLTIFLIVLLAIVAILLSLFLIFSLKGNMNFGFRFKTNTIKEIVVDEVYEEEFTSIRVETNSGDIEIKESESDVVKLVIYGDKDRTTVDNEDKEFNVKAEVKPCFGICFRDNAVKVELQVPKDYSGKMDITNKYGDVKVGEFDLAEISVVENCGDVTVKGGSVIDVQNDYGDIDIFKGNKIDVIQKCGSVVIGKVSEAKVINNFGDIEINEVTSSLDLNDNCGDIKVDKITLDKNSKIKNDLGAIEIGSTNEIFIDATTDLGKVKINENFNKSNITLDIENDCGDITINN